MTESRALRERVDTFIANFIDSRASILNAISPDVDAVTSISLRFLSGGKRLRALFCYRGWETVTGSIPDPTTPEGAALDALASSLEIFHAAALVHDDLIDNSDSRRGQPAVHRQFSSLHTESGWSGNDDAFGRSSALLLGDLLLAWSNDTLVEATASLPSTATDVLAEYSRMRVGVTAGQYLDILEEHAWPVRRDAEGVERARRVVTYKSARYSVENPIVLGALAAGAAADHVNALRVYSVPLGIAFQLRDDQLGVFGDAGVTGKPSGDDLREGKRTVLIARAIERGGDAVRTRLNASLGDPNLSAQEVAELTELIESTGARRDVEDMIIAERDAALAAIPGITASAASAQWLVSLAHQATGRDT